MGSTTPLRPTRPSGIRGGGKAGAPCGRSTPWQSSTTRVLPDGRGLGQWRQRHGSRHVPSARLWPTAPQGYWRTLCLRSSATPWPDAVLTFALPDWAGSGSGTSIGHVLLVGTSASIEGNRSTGTTSNGFSTVTAPRSEVG